MPIQNTGSRGSGAAPPFPDSAGFLLRKVRSLDSACQAVEAICSRFAGALPQDKQAPVLLKPNLNANMTALTGNTTDLRLLAAVLAVLKDAGYANVTIGEGTNSGFYRHKIDVISLLGVRRLAQRYGVPVIDLNYSETSLVEFDRGLQASVAREAAEAACLINLPVIKTHMETGMSVCLKNLIGCLVGQESKKKVHDNLALNILKLNQQLQPHLHIVDGLAAMEGLGPTRGRPVPLDLVAAGTDPFVLDYLCLKLAGFSLEQVSPLALATRMGMLTSNMMAEVDSLDLAAWARQFEPPRANALASFIHSPGRQKVFLAVRNTQLFKYLCDTGWFGKLLCLLQLRQDVFLGQEPDLGRLRVDRDACNGCGVCKDYCPAGLDPARDLPPVGESGAACSECIDCFYCFLACPQQAVAHDGNLGFLEENQRRYAHCIRECAQAHSSKRTQT